MNEVSSEGLLDLADEASKFSVEVQDLVRATLPTAAPVVAVNLENRFVVRSEDGHGRPGVINLCANGEKVGGLRLSYQCGLDHASRYLAIDSSTFTLVWGDVNNPLLRLEYDRHGKRTVPAAHWHVHAERGAFSALLAASGVKHPHSLEKLHLPVGGGRMRPCL